MKKLNWKDIPEEQVNPQMKRKFIYGERLMIAKMEFTDGFAVPWHLHDNEQITEVYEGTLRFWFDNDEKKFIDLLPGDTIVIAANRPHKALMIGNVVETDTFAPPRQDWINSSDNYLRK
ncbi:MAG: cupin domain-containing protein [Prolixibacteraceae bacterium]|jgi:quercetin dioxygenase-like cupin family protein|nr:cupin domain-containing protein [Prolixibacteraceae bacterium]